MAETIYGNGGNTSYYKVSAEKHKIYKSVKEPQEGYTEVILEDGRKFYHKYIDVINGKITGVYLNDGDYGTSLNVYLDDKDGRYCIAVKEGTGAFNAFLKRFYNVNFSESNVAINFSPYESKNGKIYSNCNVYYPDLPKIKKDEYEVYQKPEWLNSEDAPEPQEVVKGKNKGKLDFSELNDWYYEKAEELVERFKEFKGKDSTEETVVPPSKNKVKAEEEDNDDLPF